MRTAALAKIAQARTVIRTVSNQLDKVLQEPALQRTPPAMPLDEWPSREDIARWLAQVREASAAIAHWEKLLHEYGLH